MRFLQKLLFLLCFLISFNSLKAQDEIFVKIVLSSELNVRATPSLKGKLVTRLKNGDKVKYLKDQKDENCQSINNLSGCWKKIIYEGEIAFVFSAFIGDEFMLYYENTPIKYFPSVKYWYACYFDSTLQKEILVEVDVFQGESVYDDQDKTIVINTKDKRKSLFLVATNTKSRTGEVGLYTTNMKVSDTCNDYCRPGDKEWMFFKTDGSRIASECYYLLTTGNYELSERGPQLSNYSVFVADREPPNSSYSKIQKVSQHIPLSESYKLEYYGDIDGDNKPDFILSAITSSGGAHMLFLSSISKENELVGLANIFYFMSGC